MLWQVENLEELTEDEIRAYEMAARYPSVHFLQFVKIELKDKTLVRPSFMNALQRKGYQVYEMMQQLQLPCRMIWLKSRQSGGSTGSGHIAYHHCRRYSARAICIADIYSNSDNIFNIFCRFGTSDDFPWTTSFAHNSEKAQFSNRSMIDKGTAENPNAGISGTRQVVWKSEVAKWAEEGVKDARKTNSNLMASLNKNGANSLEIEESTPEGASGLFYEHWHGSKDAPGAVTLDEWLAGKRGNGMIKVFAAWHEHEEHSHDGRDGRPSVSREHAETIMATLTDREKKGIKLYGWTVEQISWRRATLAADCNNDEVLFDMHYPEDDVSCFVASGRPKFNVQGMANLKLLLYTMQPRYGLLTAQQSETLHVITFTDTNESDGWFMRYEEPKIDCRYLLVVDPATGAENTRGANPDCHSVIMWRAAYTEEQADGTLRSFPLKQVARIKPPCRWDNDRLAESIVLMSRYYGECMTVVEKNRGELIIKILREYGIPLYRFQAVDKLTGQVKEYYGWETSDESRHRAVEMTNALVRETTVENPMILVDEATHGEMQTFIVNAKGRAEARGSCHDDDVLNTCMAVATIDSATRLTERHRKRQGPVDRDRWRRMK